MTVRKKIYSYDSNRSHRPPNGQRKCEWRKETTEKRRKERNVKETTGMPQAIKIVFFGIEKSGKTSLIQKYTSNEPINPVYTPTVCCRVSGLSSCLFFGIKVLTSETLSIGECRWLLSRSAWILTSGFLSVQDQPLWKQYAPRYLGTRWFRTLFDPLADVLRRCSSGGRNI